MSHMMQVKSGNFGRVTILDLDEALIEHAHSYSHLLFCLDGKASYMDVGGERVPFDKDNGVAVNGWEPHVIIDSMSKQRALFLLFYLDQVWLTKQCVRLSLPPLFEDPSIPITLPIQRILQTIVNSLSIDDDTIDLELQIASLIEETIGNHEYLASTAAATSKMSRSVADFRIRKSVSYMRLHLDERSNFDAVAKEAGLSRPHFFSLFRKHMKMTPSVYWNTLRVEASIDRLTTTDIPLSELAYDLGFTEPGNFSRFFKNHIGIAPNQFRRVARETCIASAQP